MSNLPKLNFEIKMDNTHTHTHRAGTHPPLLPTGETKRGRHTFCSPWEVGGIQNYSETNGRGGLVLGACFSDLQRHAAVVDDHNGGARTIAARSVHFGGVVDGDGLGHGLNNWNVDKV